MMAVEAMAMAVVVGIEEATALEVQVVHKRCKRGNGTTCTASQRTRQRTTAYSPHEMRRLLVFRAMSGTREEVAVEEVMAMVAALLAAGLGTGVAAAAAATEVMALVSVVEVMALVPMVAEAMDLVPKALELAESRRMSIPGSGTSCSGMSSCSQRTKPCSQHGWNHLLQHGQHHILILSFLRLHAPAS